MAQFILASNFFDFDTTIIQQIPRTAIGAKFSPTYACLFMDRMEGEYKLDGFLLVLLTTNLKQIYKPTDCHKFFPL